LVAEQGECNAGFNTQGEVFVVFEGYTFL